jgi:ubiquinone/menaquinone biosynthesis C-methylase UbiE
MTMPQTRDDKPAATLEPAAQSAMQNDCWEAAYARFETPEQEIRKFSRRLLKAGAGEWPRESKIAELFCGRGSGLHALGRMGFANLEGVDHSATQLAGYQGPAKTYQCDCRRLPFADQSKDVVIVQGGLHHLPKLPESLEQTLAEMHRVLRKDGRVVIVEPWLTPFLRMTHAVCESPIARRVSNRVDALATMIQYEKETYEQWLTHPDLILRLARACFSPIYESFAWGKWRFVGTPL